MISVEIVTAQPVFTLEFPDAETLREAHASCREQGVARVPGVSLEVGTRCVLVFVSVDGSETLRLRGRVEATESEPPAIELKLDRERLASQDPMAAVRGLNVGQRIKLARTGGQRERVALERVYGKMVWEALLANPRITTPEVARIARKGNLPQPLLGVIVDNNAWAAAASVRRAALANPRISNPMALKLLKRTPKPELKVLPNQNAYPAAIRELARKLLKN